MRDAVFISHSQVLLQYFLALEMLEVESRGGARPDDLTWEEPEWCM